MEDIEDINKHRGTLGVLLYSIIYPDNRNITVWNKNIEDYYVKTYGTEKLKIILESVKYYFSTKKIDLSTVVPLEVPANEKENFLKMFLLGFSNSKKLQ